MIEPTPRIPNAGRSLARTRPGRIVAALAVLGVALAGGCRTEMYDQPRYDTFEPSAFFRDGASARPLVAGTVPRGWAKTDTHYDYGRNDDGTLVTTFPFQIDEEVLLRGRDRFEIFCSPCHGYVGDGNGMIVQRGFTNPPSFHEERLVEIPVGHFFEVITNGFGAMYSFAERVKPQDRWAIAAYIRALQFSQHAPVSELAAEDRQRLAEPSGEESAQ